MRQKDRLGRVGTTATMGKHRWLRLQHKFPGNNSSRMDAVVDMFLNLLALLEVFGVLRSRGERDLNTHSHLVT